jgi:hypothetical protein
MEATNIDVSTVSGQTSKSFSPGEACKFELIGPGSATFRQGAPASLTLSAGASEIDHFEVNLINESVKIGFHGGLVRNRGPQGPIHYEISIPVIEEIRFAGSLAVDLTDFKSDGLKIELKDKSTLQISGLRAAAFELKISGESRATVGGGVVRLKAKLAGKSTFSGADLDCEEAEIEARDGSEATVKVGRKLKVKASGGSTIGYSGDGVDLSVQTTGASRLTHLEIRN